MEVASGKFLQIFSWILIAGLGWSCDVDSVEKPLLSTHATRLLASDNMKLWNRITRAEDAVDVPLDNCTENTTLSLWTNQNQNNLYLVGHLPGCDPTQPADTLIRAAWIAEGDTKNEFTNVLLLTSPSPLISDINVLFLTSTNLQIEYTQSGKLINETFTYQAPVD